MNVQGKYRNGQWTGGIEWTRIKNADGSMRRGFSWNPIKGCFHGCRWTMPDGQEAVCYAETTAEGVGRSAYRHGFAHHYFQPNALHEPLLITEPAGIFLDSMSDLWGSWVPRDERDEVLGVVRRAHWHIFQSLTKAAPQMLKYDADDLPSNLWLGASSPPDTFMGQRLTRHQQERKLEKDLAVLTHLARTHTTWMSFEPLSWDVAPLVARSYGALKWAVIGAASSGRTYYAPEREHVERLLAVLAEQEVPIFYKGNLKGAIGRWGLPWREEFPCMASYLTP